MEITLMFNEDGSFNIDRSDGLSVFNAIGMMELAKVILLSEGQGGGMEEEDIDEEEMTSEDM